MAPTREPPNTWEKAEVAFGAVSAIGSILIPVALFFLGSKLAERERIQSDAQLQADRVERMLVHLASENADERRLSVRVLGYFASVGQFPSELLPALLEIASSDGRADVANTAAEVVQKVADGEEPQVAAIAQQGLEALPPRIDVHADPTDPDAATAVAELERDSEVVKQAAGSAPSTAPKTELSYFRKQDRAQAEKIAARLARRGIRAEVRDRSQAVDARANRPRGFDLVITK